MEQTRDDPEMLERLAPIADPNEFIRVYRKLTAEINGEVESELFALLKADTSDTIYLWFGMWLAFHATPPIETREQVVEIMDEMAAKLKEMQHFLPEDPELLKHTLLHCLRRIVVPQMWSGPRRQGDMDG